MEITLIRYKLSLEFCKTLITKINNLNALRVLVSCLRNTLNTPGCKGGGMLKASKESLVKQRVSERQEYTASNIALHTAVNVILRILSIIFRT
jgi:hypothetical protein